MILVLEWVFIIIAGSWIVEFILFPNRGTGKEDQVEKRSFRLIFGALTATIAAAVILGEMQSISQAAVWLKGLGVLLFGGGVFLRYWGILHLKAQFTRNVTVREGDEIVSTGPYRKLRHPLYTGLLMITLGMALFFQSIIAAILGGALVGWALAKRMDGEEAMLIEKFGDEYKEWMKKRARLIPFIY